MTMILEFAQDQATRDAVSQQVRDQINAARKEAQAAANNARTTVTAPTPPLEGTQPVSIQQIPYNPNNDIPPQAEDIAIAFFITVAAILIFWPITRALARWMDRGSAVPRLAPDVAGQLAQLSQAVDAIAVEVERISEGQRFTTRLMAEQRGDQTKTLLSPGATAPPNQG